jgi:hypothetical protein
MAVMIITMAIGAGLALVAFGGAQPLIEVRAEWLAAAIGAFSAYLVFLGGRGLLRLVSGTPALRPEQAAEKRAWLRLNGAIWSAAGMGLILLAAIGDGPDGVIAFTGRGAVLLGVTGGLLDLLGVGFILVASKPGQAFVAAQPGATTDRAAIPPDAADNAPAVRPAAPPRPIAMTLFRSGGRIVTGVLLAGGLLLLAGGPMGNCASSCMGYDDAVMARLNACPLAQELLGAPIEKASFGWSCGSAETQGAFGRASWVLPVAGPKGRGSYSFAAEQRGGPWQLLQGTLEVGEQVIDVVRCTAGQVVSLTRLETYRGVVTQVMGSTPVEPGAACSIVLGPGGEDGICRAQITCASQILYGAGETGYTPCRVEPGPNAEALLVLLDSETTAHGGDPMLDLRFSTGKVLISDQTPAGTWAVSLQLTGKQ